MGYFSTKIKRYKKSPLSEQAFSGVANQKTKKENIAININSMKMLFKLQTSAFNLNNLIPI